MASSLTQALLAIQKEVPSFQKNAIGQVQTRTYGYVTLDALLDGVLPLLQQHDVLWQTFPCFGPHGEPALGYRFTHTPTGDSEEHVMALMLDRGTPQGQGSAITYARRYALVAALNLVIDQDDDGKAATEEASVPAARTTEPLAQPTEDQATVLRNFIIAFTKELKKDHPAEWKKVVAWAKEREIDLADPPPAKLRALEKALRDKLDRVKAPERPVA